MRPIGRMFWALLIEFFSGFPDLLRDAQSGTDPKDTCPKDTSPKDTSPKDTRPSDCCCRA